MNNSENTNNKLKDKLKDKLRDDFICVILISIFVTNLCTSISLTIIGRGMTPALSEPSIIVLSILVVVQIAMSLYFIIPLNNYDKALRNIKPQINPSPINTNVANPPNNEYLNMYYYHNRDGSIIYPFKLSSN
jgi:hypothetical protein